MFDSVWPVAVVYGSSISAFLFQDSRQWLAQEVSIERWVWILSATGPLALLLTAGYLYRWWRRRDRSLVHKAEDQSTGSIADTTPNAPSNAPEALPEPSTFEEGEFDGVYWRWIIVAPEELRSLKPYCVQCDYDLKLRNPDLHFEGHNFLTCSECGHETRFDSYEGVPGVIERAANKIRRAMRNEGIRKTIGRNANTRKVRLAKGPSNVPKPLGNPSREAVRTALDAAIALEKYARACGDRITEIEDALAESARTHSHDPLGAHPFPTFAFPPTLDWDCLRPEDETILKQIEVASDSSARHLKGLADQIWVDPEEHAIARQLECGKLGFGAWSVATVLRNNYSLPEAQLGEHDAYLLDILQRPINEDEQLNGKMAA